MLLYYLSSVLCVSGYFYGISCIRFAEFRENGSVIHLLESEADAILVMSKERKFIKRRNSFIEALALLPKSQYCRSSSPSPQRADRRQVPVAVARRKMGKDNHACMAI